MGISEACLLVSSAPVGMDQSPPPGSGATSGIPANGSKRAAGGVGCTVGASAVGPGPQEVLDACGGTSWDPPPSGADGDGNAHIEPPVSTGGRGVPAVEPGGTYGGARFGDSSAVGPPSGFAGCGNDHHEPVAG